MAPEASGAGRIEQLLRGLIEETDALGAFLATSESIDRVGDGAEHWPVCRDLRSVVALLGPGHPLLPVKVTGPQTVKQGDMEVHLVSVGAGHILGLVRREAPLVPPQLERTARDLSSVVGTADRSRPIIVRGDRQEHHP